jgi:hypothetical protein
VNIKSKPVRDRAPERRGALRFIERTEAWCSQSRTRTDCPFGDAYARRLVRDQSASGEPFRDVALPRGQATHVDRHRPSFIGTDGGGEAFVIDFSQEQPRFGSMSYIGDQRDGLMYVAPMLDAFMQRIADGEPVETAIDRRLPPVPCWRHCCEQESQP